MAADESPLAQAAQVVDDAVDELAGIPTEDGEVTEFHVSDLTTVGAPWGD